MLGDSQRCGIMTQTFSDAENVVSTVGGSGASFLSRLSGACGALLWACARRRPMKSHTGIDFNVS